MKTQVILKRPFMGGEISQKSDSGFFSATELVKIGNNKRKELGASSFNLAQFLKLKSTKQFIEELQKENDKVLKIGRGRNAGTWVHPLLFIDIALALNPKLKIEVYKWLFDELIKYRNDSGNSYKKMCGSLYENSTNKKEFHKYIIRVANFIKKSLKVTDWNCASEDKLRLRNKIHENISFLSSVLRDNDQSIRIGVQKTIEEFTHVGDKTNYITTKHSTPEKGD